MSENGSNAYFASSVALIMMVVAVAVFLQQQYFSTRKNYNMSMLNPIQPKKIPGIGNIFAHLHVYLVTICATLPQVYIIWRMSYTVRSSSAILYQISPSI